VSHDTSEIIVIL